MPKKGEKKQKKSAGAKTVAKKTSGVRVRKTTRKQAKKKNKSEVKKRAPLPNSFKLAAGSFVFIKKFWRPLLGIVLVYTTLNFIFASGVLSNINSGVSSVKSDLQSSHSKLSSALSGFSNLAVTGNGQGSSMQSVLLVLESLVIIWALRQLFAGEKIKVKQAYYRSMAPLVPFLVVLFFILLQLLPFAVSSAVLVLVLSTISGSAAVVVFFSVLFALASAWSVYMLSSSVFALYIVTLPDMQPRAALKSAKKLVRFRRWQLIRKVLFLPLEIFVILGLITIPLILVVSFLVTPVFFALLMLTVLYTHTYLYSLYKGLLA